MSAFEYVIVMVSVVLSLGVAHSLGGFAMLIQGERKVRWSLVHGIWWLIAFSFNIDLWLSAWTVRDQAVWPLASILAAFGAACLAYLANYLATPRDTRGDEPLDLWAFHQRNRRRYLAAMILYMVLGMVLNATLLPEEFQAANLTTTLPGLACMAVATAFSNLWIQRVAALTAGALVTFYFVSYFSVIGAAPGG